MTARLPTPGGDLGTWGTLYNTFLGVSHNVDGTLVTSQVSSALGGSLSGPIVIAAAPTGTAATDRANLNSAIAAAAGVTLVLREGTYVIDQTLTTPSNDTLIVGKGKYATTIKPDASTNVNVFSIASGTGIILRDFGVDVNGANQSQAKTGILFTGSTDCACENMYFCNATQTGSNALAITTTGVNNRFRVSNCDFNNNSRHFFVGGASLDTAISNCTFRSGLTTNGAEGSLYIASASRTKVIGCLVTGAAGSGAYVGAGSDNEFIGCHFMSNGGTTAARRGLHIQGGAGTYSGTKVIGCHFELNAEQGIYVQNGTDGVIQGCTVKNNNACSITSTTNGIEIDTDTGWLVSTCRVQGNLGNCHGIYAPDQSTISGCQVVGNGMHGIYIADTKKHVTVTGCKIKNNGVSGTGYGIYINDLGNGGSVGHVITGNNIYDDAGASGTQVYGINIVAAIDRVTVQGNNVYQNKTGAISGTGTNSNIGNNIIA